MHIKWLKHGTGPAALAVSYVLAESDCRGAKRELVEVLRGDPRQMAELADSLEFRHRYQSAVISWAPEDAPADDEIAQVLDDFERAMYAGFGPDPDLARLSWTAVRHEEGGTHLHVLVARVDLETGRSYAVAPPGWQRLYDPLRDHHNYLHGWARPDDPARARTVQPGVDALVKGNRNTAKQQITGWLTERIQSGEIADRAGIAAALEELGEVTRQGADYISVRPEGAERAVRLKGGIYVDGFDAAAICEAGTEAGRECGPVRDPNPAEAERARRRFEEAIERRAQRDAGRYRIRKPKSTKEPESAQERRAQADKGIAGDTPSRSQTAQMGHESAAGVRDPDHRLDGGRDLGMVEVSEAMGPSAHEKRPDVPGPERRLDGDLLGQSAEAAMPPSPWWQQAWESVRGLYDGVRDAVVGRFRAAIHAIRIGAEAASSTDRSLVTAAAAVEQAGLRLSSAGADAGRACDDLGRSAQQLERQTDRVCRALKMRCDDELERFKSQINLTEHEYPASQGYQRQLDQAGLDLGLTMADDPVPGDTSAPRF